MKKADHAIKKPLFFAAYILLVVFASYTASKGAGFLRSLPFAVILPAAATLFYNKKLLTTGLVFVCSLVFLLVETEKITECIITALLFALIAGAGILVKRFFVTAYVSREKRIFCALSGAVILAAAVIFYCFLFGNPVSFMISRAGNLGYMEKTYGEKAPDTAETYYDFTQKRYFTNVNFADTSPVKAIISAKEPVYDGYSNYYEFVLLSERREEMAEFLSSHFSAGDFALRINVSGTEISATPETKAEDVFDEMVFDIAFYSQLSEKDAFAEKCRGYAQALAGEGFEFKTVNFYGGFADEFLFSLSVPYGESTDVSENVTDFDGEVFERYYDELDYADGWSFGS